MRNRIRIYLSSLLATIVALSGFAPVLAAFDDVQFTDGSEMSVSGYTLTVLTGGKVESIEVGATTFTVTMPANSAIIVRSTDKVTFTAAPNVNQTDCQSSYSQIYLNGTMAASVTVTVSATTCAVGGGGGGGGGSDPAPTPSPGGGGGGSTTVTTPAPSVPTPDAATGVVPEACPLSLVGGTMVKVIGAPAIYSLDNMLRYYYFADGDAFKSWNMDGAYAGKYVSITSACLNALPSPSQAPYHVFYRPGTNLVHRAGDKSQLYVVQPNHTLAKISLEAAKALYGATLAGSPKAIGLSEWPFYEKSSMEVSDKAHSGMWVKVDGKIWQVTSDLKVREVSSVGLTDNRVNGAFVHTLSASAVADYPVGDPISGYEAGLSDRLR